MSGLPEGIGPMDATILEAYAANGEVSKFREVANKLPSTPAVLAWVSECLRGSAGSAGPSKTALGQRRSAAGGKDAAPAPSRKRRASTPLSVQPVAKRKPLLQDYSSPDAIDDVDASEGSSTGPIELVFASPSPRSVMDSPPRRFISPNPSEDDDGDKRKAFLTAIIKALPIANVRVCVRKACKYADVTIAVTGEPPKEYSFLSSRDSDLKNMKPAAVRKICLDAALVHQEIKEDVLVSSPAHVIEKCLGKDEVEEMCEHFLRRAKSLLRKCGNTGKYSRVDSLPKVAAGIAKEIEDMLDILLERASLESTLSDSKKACLTTTTILVAACLAPCPAYNFLFPTIKQDHATQWDARVRLIMRKLTDKELLQMRRAGYDNKLLRLWKHVRRYNTKEAFPMDPYAITRWKELGQRPPPEPKIWPDFERKTMRYFAERTGGWDKAWDPVKRTNCFGYEVWV